MLKTVGAGINFRAEQTFYADVCLYKKERSNLMPKSTETNNLQDKDIERIIEMAWEDRTPFDAIRIQFGLSEQEVIALMRRNMKASSWRMWRARVQGRRTKHAARTPIDDKGRFKSGAQRHITLNKISKR
jgi:uncharacterized protein (TIGR03643 family)